MKDDRSWHRSLMFEGDDAAISTSRAIVVQRYHFMPTWHNKSVHEVVGNS
jgi:hypothetical protein